MITHQRVHHLVGLKSSLYGYIPLIPIVDYIPPLLVDYSYIIRWQLSHANPASQQQVVDLVLLNLLWDLSAPHLDPVGIKHLAGMHIQVGSMIFQSGFFRFHDVVSREVLKNLSGNHVPMSKS